MAWHSALSRAIVYVDVAGCGTFAGFFSSLSAYVGPDLAKVLKPQVGAQSSLTGFDVHREAEKKEPLFFCE